MTDADDGGWGDDDGGWGDDGEDGGGDVDGGESDGRSRHRPGEPTSSEPFFDATRRDGVLELARERAEWLSTGWRGGRTRADAVYNCTVPGNWRCDDVAGFVRERLDEAGFAESGVGVEDAPVLLTGVAMEHARGARVGPVEAYATAGVSNPAALPTEPAGGDLPDGEYVAGTVNVVVGTTRAPAPGAFANLVAIAAEARAATLLSRVGVPGTTSDAVVVASDPDGDPATFSGSATRVGAATRACVREAVDAALDARYGTADGDDVGHGDGGDDPPASPGDARYGVSTDVRADVFEP